MKVSIIIPSLNKQSSIAQAIESVLSQTYKDIEIIIVDGCSKDETLNIVEKYKNESVNIISEQDKGVFDALNKGIKLSQGELIGWLGADDFYANERVIKKAVDAIERSNSQICWGDLVYIDRHDVGKILRYWKSSDYKKGLFERGWQLPHFTSFVKRNVFETYGYFSLDFKIAADYDFFLRILEKHKIKSCYIPEILLKMRVGGQSNRSILNIIKGNIECFKSLKRNGIKRRFLPFVLKPLFKVVQYISRP